MISTDITSTIDRPVDRNAVRAASVAPVVNRAIGRRMPSVTAGVTAGVTADATYQKSVDHRVITAELPVSCFRGQVWLRPAALDVMVLATPGHLAWSPPV